MPHEHSLKQWADPDALKYNESHSWLARKVQDVFRDIAFPRGSEPGKLIYKHFVEKFTPMLNEANAEEAVSQYFSKTLGLPAPSFEPMPNAKSLARQVATPEIFLTMHESEKPDIKFSSKTLHFLNSRKEECSLDILTMTPGEKILLNHHNELRQEVVLYVTGRGDVKERRYDEVAALVQQGVTVVLFNFPGLGLSEGLCHSFSDFVASTRSVIYDLLARDEVAPGHKLDRRRLTLYGNCTGAAIALSALMDEKNIRLIFSNSGTMFSQLAADLMRESRLGVIRAVEKAIHFDWNTLFAWLMWAIDFDIQPVHAIKHVPDHMYVVFQRKPDGIISHSMMYDTLKERWADGSLIDECPRDFREVRDKLWQDGMMLTKKPHPDKEIARVRNYHPWWKHCLFVPTPFDANYADLPHYAKAHEVFSPARAALKKPSFEDGPEVSDEEALRTLTAQIINYLSASSACLQKHSNENYSRFQRQPLVAPKISLQNWAMSAAIVMLSAMVYCWHQYNTLSQMQDQNNNTKLIP